MSLADIVREVDTCSKYVGEGLAVGAISSAILASGYAAIRTGINRATTGAYNLGRNLRDAFGGPFAYGAGALIGLGAALLPGHGISGHGEFLQYLGFMGTNAALGVGLSEAFNRTNFPNPTERRLLGATVGALTSALAMYFTHN